MIFTTIITIDIQLCSLQKRIAIDPSRLIPGAAPPVASHDDTATFEEPVRTAGLSSATKVGGWAWRQFVM